MSGKPLIILLNELRSEIDKVAPDKAKTLNPGLSKDKIEAMLNELPFKIGDDAIVLYEWANGSEPEEFEILPGWYFIPLEHAIERTMLILDAFGDMGGDDFEPYLNNLWILTDYSDGGLGIGSIDEPCNGKIVIHSIHESWEIGFNSLHKMIETAIMCYKDGVYNDEDDPDFDLYYDIAQRINFGIPYWRS